MIGKGNTSPSLQPATKTSFFLNRTSGISEDHVGISLMAFRWNIVQTIQVWGF